MIFLLIFLISIKMISWVIFLFVTLGSAYNRCVKCSLFDDMIIVKIVRMKEEKSRLIYYLDARTHRAEEILYMTLQIMD